MKTATIALIAGAGALAVATAFAAHHEKKEGDYDWEAKVEEHFNAVDANSDGNVTGDEFMAYMAKKAEAKWTKMAEVAGDDGMLSLDEAKAHHAAMKAEKEAMKEEGGE